MPIVFVYGVPINEEPKALTNLLGDIQEAVASVKELGLKKEDVIVFFPKDLVEQGLGEEIIIFVKGVCLKPDLESSDTALEVIVKKCTIIQKLAEVIGKKAKDFYYPNSLVEVFVENTDPCRVWSSKT